MDRMADSGSVGWAFESPRDHKKRLQEATFFNDKNQKVKDKSKK